MAGPNVDGESPLSITASISGILTFLVAIVGAVWLRINSLRGADTEYERVKTALKWWVAVCFYLLFAIFCRTDIWAKELPCLKVQSKEE